jgi:hypothetical protein
MPMPHTKLYHFTNTARLLWIVGAKELRPNCNQIGGFPSPDFLWATTRSQGDRTASGNARLSRAPYVSGAPDTICGGF